MEGPQVQERSSVPPSTGRRHGGGRSSEKCALCRRSRLKCLPVQRDWSRGEKCDRCTKTRKPCGPNLSRKEESQTQPQVLEAISRPNSNSSSLPSDDSGNRNDREMTTSDSRMDVVDSGSSSEGTSSADRIGPKYFKAFSRHKLDTVDKWVLKSAHLFLHLEEIPRDENIPSAGAIVSLVSRYAVEGVLEYVVKELEYTIPKLAKQAEAASARGENALADRIFLRLFDGLKSSLDLSIKHRWSTLIKMVSFYQKIEDEPQLQKVLRILSSLSMSNVMDHSMPNVMDTTMNPNKLLANSLLATSSSMSTAIAGVASRRVGAPPVHSPALHQSVRCENPEVFRFVLLSIINTMQSAATPAAAVSHFEGTFLTTPSDPNMNLEGRDNHGRTPLFLACSLADEDKAEALIRAGARVNEMDNDGRSIIEVAAGRGLLKTVGLLRQFQEKADVNPTMSQQGSTPLLEAAANGHVEVVRFLVEEGAFINTERRYDKKTAKQLARENGHPAVVAELTERGDGESAQTTSTGSTPRESQQMVPWVSQQHPYLVLDQIAGFFPTPHDMDSIMIGDRSSQGYGLGSQDGYSPDERQMEEAGLDSMTSLDASGQWAPQGPSPFVPTTPSLDTPFDLPTPSMFQIPQMWRTHT